MGHAGADNNKVGAFKGFSFMPAQLQVDTHCKGFMSMVGQIFGRGNISNGYRRSLVYCKAR